MNQFAIFYLLTLTVLYVSFATADGNPDKYVCKLKEAKYDHDNQDIDVETFNKRKVYLYTHKPRDGSQNIVPNYVIKDGSKKPSNFFPIYISNTIIFENRVEILANFLGLAHFITITPDEDTFKFGRRFFAIDNFTDQHKFLVTEFSLNGIKLEDVTTIKAKEAEGVVPCGAFIVLDRNNKPRFFFSTKTFTSPEKNNSKVSITLATKPRTFITIEFAESAGADQFCEFVGRFSAN